MSLALLTSHRVSLDFVDIVLVHPKKVNRTKSKSSLLLDVFLVPVVCQPLHHKAITDNIHSRWIIVYLIVKNGAESYWLLSRLC